MHCSCVHLLSTVSKKIHYFNGHISTDISNYISFSSYFFPAWKGEIYNKGQGNLEIGREGDSAGERTRIRTPYFSGSWEREKNLKQKMNFKINHPKAPSFIAENTSFLSTLRIGEKGLGSVFWT